jgi:D-serine dehydratase
MAIGQPFEVANEIGPPISASDHTYNDWFFHITAIDGSEGFSFSLLLALSILIISVNVVFTTSVHMQATALAHFRSFRKSHSASLLSLL